MFHYEREPVSPLRRRFIDDLRLIVEPAPTTGYTRALSKVPFHRLAVGKPLAPAILGRVQFPVW
jgi:hypothetical protein